MRAILEKVKAVEAQIVEVKKQISQTPPTDPFKLKYWC